jgi:hypothetical protein
LLSDAEKSTRRAREIKQENVHLNMGANNSKEGCRNRSRSALRRVHPDSTDNREHMQEEIESEETEREVNTPIQEDRPPVSPLPLPPLPPPVPERSYNIPGLLPPLIPPPSDSQGADPEESESREKEKVNQDSKEEKLERRENSWEKLSRKNSVPDSDAEENEKPEYSWDRITREKEDEILRYIKEKIGGKNFLTNKEIDLVEEMLQLKYKHIEKRVSRLDNEIIMNKKFSTSNYSFYQCVRMILVSKQIANLTDSRRENLSLTHRADLGGEIGVKKPPPGSCIVCLVEHTTETEIDCFKRLTTGGPRIGRYLMKSNGWKTAMKVAIIGFSSWLYIHPMTSNEVLNLGQYHVGRYNAGLEDNLPGYDVDESRGSLHDQLGNILRVLYSTQPVKVLIEYHEPPNHSKGTQLETFIGFLRVIKVLQRYTWHQLIVLTSPFLATAGDTDTSHRHDAWQRHVSNQVLELTSRAMGIPCFNPPLQQVITEDRTDVVQLNPIWNKEALSTPIGNITKELMYRQTVELSLILELARRFPVRIPSHVGYGEQEI